MNERFVIFHKLAFDFGARVWSSSKLHISFNAYGSFYKNDIFVIGLKKRSMSLKIKSKDNIANEYTNIDNKIIRPQSTNTVSQIN